MYKKWKKQHPFIAEYAVTTSIHTSSSTVVMAGEAHDDVEEWYPLSKTLELIQNKEYALYFNLVPKVSTGIKNADLRFIGDDLSELPKVTHFHDLSPQSQGLLTPAGKNDRVKSFALFYKSAVEAIENGKAIDYLVLVQTLGVWEGQISLRLGLTNIGVRYVRIKCKVNQPTKV